MRTYDKEFKINAVKLCKNNDRSISLIARELGLAGSTLSKWIREYKENEDESFPGKGKVKSSEEEVIALRKELNHVRQERDILKKAVAIFSSPQGRGTNS